MNCTVPVEEESAHGRATTPTLHSSVLRRLEPVLRQVSGPSVGPG